MDTVDFAVWPVEASAMLLSRSVCGDEATLEVGKRILTDDARVELAERHPAQVASLVETQAVPDDG